VNNELEEDHNHHHPDPPAGYGSDPHPGLRGQVPLLPVRSGHRAVVRRHISLLEGGVRGGYTGRDRGDHRLSGGPRGELALGAFLLP